MKFVLFTRDILAFERDPDKGMRRDRGTEFERVRQAIAVYLGTSADNLALVENTTTGQSQG